MSQKARESIGIRLIRACARVAMAYVVIAHEALAPMGAWVTSAQAATSAGIAITMRVADDHRPGNVADLVATTTAGSPEGRITLTWTEPGHDAFSGESAYQYVLKYRTAGNIENETDFSSATAFTDRAITPGTPGGLAAEVITGLCPGTTYYFALKANNGHGGEGTWSRSGGANPNNFAAASNTNPPAVSNLTALTGDQLINLNWTSTNVCDFSKYRILRATESPPASVLTELTLQSTTNYLDTGVVNGTTYYYIVQTFDLNSLSSSTAVFQAFASSTGLPNKPVILSTSTVALSTSRVQWSWSYASPPGVRGFRVVSSSGGVISEDLSRSATHYVQSGFSPNQKGRVLVRAFNEIGTKDSDEFTRYALANPPTGSKVEKVTDSTVELGWGANGNVDAPTFEIMSATNKDFENSSSTKTTETNFTLKSLLSDTTYYIKIRARNGDDLVTDFDVTLTTRTLSGSDSRAPGAPGGARGGRSGGGGAGALTSTVKFEWTAVTTNDDGTALNDLKGYLVRVSAAVPSDSASWSEAVTSDTSYTVEMDGSASRYFAVRAVDTSNNQSKMSMVYKWPDNIMLMPTNDPASRYEIPMAANRDLLADGNGRDSDYVATMKEVTGDYSNGLVAKAIQVEVRKAKDGKAVADFVFNTAGKIALGYTVENGKVLQGSPALQKGTPVLDASKAKQQLALFWFNGINWVKLGGDVDVTANEVSFRTARVGKFQIRQAIRLGDLTLVQVYPRIVTPNGDGKNDVVIFQFGEGSLTGVDIKGQIFDITGAKVADLQAGPDPDTSLKWDGKDSSGKTCLSGIYIYQIEVGGNRTNGTVVVAR